MTSSLPNRSLSFAFRPKYWIKTNDYLITKWIYHIRFFLQCRHMEILPTVLSSPFLESPLKSRTSTIIIDFMDRTQYIPCIWFISLKLYGKIRHLHIYCITYKKTNFYWPKMHCRRSQNTTHLLMLHRRIFWSFWSKPIDPPAHQTHPALRVNTISIRKYYLSLRDSEIQKSRWECLRR